MTVHKSFAQLDSLGIIGIMALVESNCGILIELWKVVKHCQILVPANRTNSPMSRILFHCVNLSNLFTTNRRLNPSSRWAAYTDSGKNPATSDSVFFRHSSFGVFARVGTAGNHVARAIENIPFGRPRTFLP